MELIEVDKLRDDILNDSDYDNDTINHFLYLVDSQPTVDAEPVRYGKWIMRRDSKNLKTIATCSCCGYEHSYFVACNVAIDKMTYCPNCGAKMEEEIENG